MTNATATTKVVSKSAKFLAALQNGEALTAKQIAARFGIGNPTATVSDLRLRGGYAIYATATKSGVSRYRLGNPARAVVAAGYRAMAASKAS
jgi:hypothetical protein